MTFTMARWLGFGLQNILSSEGKAMTYFLDLNFMILLFIVLFVLSIMIMVYSSKYIHLMSYENNALEFIWTALPGVILIFLGIPSIKLLYSLELKHFSEISIKITGHQWYWTYDYSNWNNIVFDSFMKPMKDLVPGEFRLLETDNHLVLPLIKSRSVVSSDDVLHSWAVPALGVKMDANPGRMNTIYMNSLVPGLYYGQCSEICGANHSFMPIVVEYTLFNYFKEWTKLMK